MAHKFHKEAMQCFAQAEKLQPKEPRWPYHQGVMLLWWDANAAIPKLERAAELTGNTPIAPRLRLADALLERGQLEQAGKHLQVLVKDHAMEPYVLLGMGKLELARGQLDEALKYLAQSAASPQTARTSVALIASILQRQGKAAAAAEASSQVAALPPDPSMIDPFLGEVGDLQTGMQAWLDRAERLFKANKANEGLALLGETVETYPNSAAPWRMLGQAQMRQRDPAAAERSLRKAVELSPRESASHYQLGTVLGAQGRFAEAAESFRRAIELKPNDPSAFFHLGQCFMREGNMEKAIDAYRAAIRYDPTLSAAHSQLGTLLGEQGRYDEAIEALARAVKLDPSDARATQDLEKAKRSRDAKP
jgi:tetratricopeptide (TPR) repeat protein